MSKVVIKAENISKQYRLGLVGTGTVKDDMKRWWYNLRGKEDPFLKIGEANNRATKGESDYVWSLQDINFEINQGDSVGIIGRNGAGKSTLLKILSQVTQPTTGKIYTKGRIASLLEVGTGFHPEMTGKENIFLNGAILGMRKAEIKRKFDEIVDFSGVERYIDTPVKRYSSGMYVRLAFAVAAHLESEILIVDEVLAVGDAEFQKKCLGKMNDVSKGEGRTVLFVSHNLAAVKSLCTKGVLLENGKNVINGDIDNVIGHYLSHSNNLSSRRWDNVKNPGCDFIKLLEVKVLDANNNEALNHEIYNDIQIEFVYEVLMENQLFTHGFNLFNDYNVHILSSHDKDSTTLNEPLQKGIHSTRIVIPGDFLAEGGYNCSFAIMRYSPFHVEFHELDLVGFNIIDDINNNARGGYSGKYPGVVRPILKWK